MAHCSAVVGVPGNDGGAVEVKLSTSCKFVRLLSGECWHKEGRACWQPQTEDVVPPLFCRSGGQRGLLRKKYTEGGGDQRKGFTKRGAHQPFGRYRDWSQLVLEGNIDNHQTFIRCIDCCRSRSIFRRGDVWSISNIKFPASESTGGQSRTSRPTLHRRHVLSFSWDQSPICVNIHDIPRSRIFTDGLWRSQHKMEFENSIKSWVRDRGDSDPLSVQVEQDN